MSGGGAAPTSVYAQKTVLLPELLTTVSDPNADLYRQQ